MANQCKCGGIMLYLFSFSTHNLNDCTDYRLAVFVCKDCHNITFKLEDK